MNAGSEKLSPRNELRYLIRLTARGVKPLSRWEMDITPEEWATIEAGVAQRIRALEAFLADVYSSGQIMQDGVIPRALVTSSTHFHRQAWGIEPPNGVRIHVSGSDLIRDDYTSARKSDNQRIFVREVPELLAKKPSSLPPVGKYLRY